MRLYACKLIFLTILIVLSKTGCCTSIYYNRVYVSSSYGNDDNDGRTEQTPVKTIRNALMKSDTLLLRCGDVFFENVEIKKGKIMSYGEGPLPILCGYKRITEAKWVEVGQNVWKICLSDIGYSGYNVKGSSMLNNIGCFHEYDNNQIHGRRVQYLNELNEEWDYWQTEHHTKKDVKASDFDTLYLYINKDPNELKLEFSTGATAAIIANTVLDGIKFEGFGFGISASSNSIIINCEIDAIGGRMGITNSEFVSYGNGIEFYVSGTKDVKDCLVEKCKVSRCYDCGITIQGKGGTTATPRNIIIRNNFIEDCCQGWEDFLRNNKDVVYNNCVFEFNTVVNSGNNTGFGYPKTRAKFCHVLGNNKEGNKGMIIRNNTFVGGNYYCSGSYKGEYKSNIWENNICVIERGDFILSNYSGTKDVIRIPTHKGEFRTIKAATDDAIQRYRQLTGDETTKFVIVGKSEVRRKINKLKKKYSSK